MKFEDVINYEIIFEKPKRIKYPWSWVKHIPFAMFLVEIINPDLFVELGTHSGNSYCAFCQAVEYLHLNTKCFAIDNWKGDEHAGYYQSQIYDDLKKYHDPKYGSFSKLLKMDFDDGLSKFNNKSIDLLHIDGLHTYEAVKKDFENWLPKISDRGVILFHDTNVHENDFGVWKLWQELESIYPSFEFTFGFGLGVLGVGKNCPKIIGDLLFLRENVEIINIFSALGENISYELELQKSELELQKSEKINFTYKSKLFETEAKLVSMERSKGWKLVLFLRRIRKKLIPKNSKIEELAKKLSHFHFNLNPKNIAHIFHSRSINIGNSLKIQKSLDKPNHISKHKTNVDIIICIHNALEDVKRCLESIEKFTHQPYKIILVDDGSNVETKKFLETFEAEKDICKLFRNSKPIGYTNSANIGIKKSTSDFVVLLNSDTVVGSMWLDRMMRIMDQEKDIGFVGPLSNTASWQSIPELEENGDWASNPLPRGIGLEFMSELVERYSAEIHPEAFLLNGFCMLIRRKVFTQVGLFDEENFGQGYGEEDDLILRASEFGWKIKIADDVYVYHAQSKSYTNDTRKKLSEQNTQRLLKKHGKRKISARVKYMSSNPIMEGIRSRMNVMFDREGFITAGKERFSGRKALFILPVIDPGGGANVVIDEARSMRKMGVDVQIFNLDAHKDQFLSNYPHLDIPVIFDQINNLLNYSDDFDAFIATAHYSVKWLKPLESICKEKLFYYAQGFEPLMYENASINYKLALFSYSEIEGMDIFSKTKWVSEKIFIETGLKCSVVGPSVNIDLFCPRHAFFQEEKMLLVLAMVRSGSPYRSPDFTCEILREIKKRFNNNVHIGFFGSKKTSDVVDKSLLDFEYRDFGVLTQHQVAQCLSFSDIFVDFSSHQAMGLTLLEAMACGCAVVAPENGGAKEFISDKKNGLIVDTSNIKECADGLDALIRNNETRKSIQSRAIKSVSEFYPERTAYKILSILFPKNHA